MWQAVSTEVAGWREALADPINRAIILKRLALVALSSAASVASVGYVRPALAVLAVTLIVLAGSLALLRVRGRP
jgi:hypothetical protein